MFKASEIDAAHSGPAPTAAALSLGQVLAEPALSWRERIAAWRHRLDSHCAGWDFTHDLAEDIGSRVWLRGLGTFAGLAVFAISFWPDFSAVEAATATPPDRAIHDELRSQMIMPLARGSESGRRMAPTRAVVPLTSVPERARIELAATLAEGDSFGRMLQRAGVGAADAERVTELIASAVPLGDLAPGTRVAIVLGRRAAPDQPRALERAAFRARFDLDLAIVRSGGALALTRRPVAVDATPLRIRGKVGASLYRSARAAGAPASAIQQYLQTLDRNYALDSDLSPDDYFDLVVGYRRAAGGEGQAGELLYAGLEHGGKPKVQLLRWGKSGQFMAASGFGQQQMQGGTFAPVAGRLTSGFGMRRHPILGYARMHAGVDYGAPWGAPIYAVSAGTISWAGRHGGHGNYVRIEHGGGLGSGYAHMSKIAVQPGAQVQAGQVIGYVGSTGLSTGPHLHFEVYASGRKVNPLSVRFSKAVKVDPGERSAFDKKLAQMLAIDPGLR